MSAGLDKTAQNQCAPCPERLQLKKNNNNNKGKGYLTLTSGLFEHLHAHMHTCTHHTHSVSVYPCLFLSLPLSGDTLTVTESVTSTGGLDRDLKVHLNFYNYN